MTRKITMDEVNASIKQSRIKLALARDNAKALWMNVWSSVRMKIDRNPEQENILAEMARVRGKYMFEYLWIKNWLRTVRLRSKEEIAELKRKDEVK